MLYFSKFTQIKFSFSHSTTVGSILVILLSLLKVNSREFPFYLQSVLRSGTLLYGLSARNSASILCTTRNRNSTRVCASHTLMNLMRSRMAESSEKKFEKTKKDYSKLQYNLQKLVFTVGCNDFILYTSKKKSS